MTLKPFKNTCCVHAGETLDVCSNRRHRPEGFFFSVYHLSPFCNFSSQNHQNEQENSQLVFLDRKIKKNICIFVCLFLLHYFCIFFHDIPFKIGGLGFTCSREKAVLYPHGSASRSEHQQKWNSCIIYGMKTSQLCKILYPTSCASKVVSINCQKLQHCGSLSGHKLKN